MLYNSNPAAAAPTAAPAPAQQPGFFPMLGLNLQNIPIVGTFVPMFTGQQQTPQDPSKPANQGGGILGGWPQLPNLQLPNLQLPNLPNLPNLGGILGGGGGGGGQSSANTCPLGQIHSCKCEPVINLPKPGGKSANGVVEILRQKYKLNNDQTKELR